MTVLSNEEKYISQLEYSQQWFPISFVLDIQMVWHWRRPTESIHSLEVGSRTSFHQVALSIAPELVINSFCRFWYSCRKT